MQPEPERITLSPAPGRAIAAERLRGARAAFVWLHGLTSVRDGEKSRALFALARQLDHAAWRFDFRGHGESTGTLSDTTLSELVDDTRAVLDLAGPAWLIGSSLGGLVAAWTAARHPRSVLGLVLIAPALRFLPRLRARLDSGDVPTFTHASGTIRFTPRVLDDFAAHDEAELAAALHQPTLIAHGEHDDTVPVTASEEFVARIPHARKRLLVLAGGDHRLNREIDAILLAAREFHGW